MGSNDDRRCSGGVPDEASLAPGDNSPRNLSRACGEPKGPVPSPLMISSIFGAGSSPSTSSRARATSARTTSALGVTSRPGAPAVPDGTTVSGPFAASTTRRRGTIIDASSASPNCSRRPKTLRSMGSCQTSRRSSKYPLTHAVSIRRSRAAAQSVRSPPSPQPITPIEASAPESLANQSTAASTFCTS